MPRERSPLLFKVDTLQFGVKLLVFTLICGRVVGQSKPQYHGNPDSMVFPEPLKSTPVTFYPTARETIGNSSELVRSLQIAQEINSMESVEEFLKLVHGVPPEDKSIFISSRFGEGEERSNAQYATPANCIPELQPVPLKQDDDPSTMFYPTCTRIKRCGGCCSHPLLSCQPVATEIRNFEVVVTTVGGSLRMNYRGKRIVPLEEHTKCKCACRIKPEHCSEKQIYIPKECRCVCSNVDEAEKCAKSNDTKLWDPDLCTCLCRNIQECSTGYYFDQNTCRCERKE